MPDNQMFYTAMEFFVITALMMMQLFVRHSLALSRRQKTLFRLLYTVTAFAAFCEWLGCMLQGASDGTRLLHIAVKACELSIAPSIGYLFAWILDSRYKKTAVALLIVNAVLECLSGVFGFIYSVDAANVYTHARYYFIYVFFYILSALYCLIGVFRNVKKYQYSGSRVFALLMAWMMTGIIIQLVDSTLKVDYVAVGMASIMAYVFVAEMIQQTDELTELLNRRGFENCIMHIEQKCIIVFFDVDRFKSLNDDLGHACGDAALKDIGAAIKRCYALHGKCFRYGGDEFCAILDRDIERVEEINSEFFREMDRQRKKNSVLPRVSLGYSLFVPGSDNITDVVRTADEMMYRYKQEHRDEVMA